MVFLFGLMIALLDEFTRKACLVVHWNNKETTTFTLGDTPIILGSSGKAHVYLSKTQGYFPVTAKIFQQGNMTIMEFNRDYGRAKGMKKLTQTLAAGKIRKFGEIQLEIQSL